MLALCAATIGVSHFLHSYRYGKISEVSDVSSILLLGASKMWGGVPTDIPIVEKILAISRQHAVAPPQKVTERFLYTSPCTILQRMMMAVVLKTSFTFSMLFKRIYSIVAENVLTLSFILK